MKPAAAPKIDKDQLTAKCFVAIKKLAAEADKQAKEFGAKGDFDSPDARRAFSRADTLDRAVRSLNDLRYFAALEQMSLVGTLGMINLGMVAKDEPEALMKDLHALATPQVGDGATVSYINDRYGGTVVQVSASGATIVVQADKSTNTKKWPEQSYTFERDPNGRTWTARRGRTGVYKVQGGGARVTVGPRDEYQAPEI